MSKLKTCICPECGTEFTMARDDLAEVVEVTCPICDETFDPFRDEGSQVAGLDDK